mgnify:CR=1 FL=1
MSVELIIINLFLNLEISLRLYCDRSRVCGIIGEGNYGQNSFYYRYLPPIRLDAQEYDREVIRKTNETSARAFPVTLNVEHPAFFPKLERCAQRNEALKAIKASHSPKIVKFFRQLPLITGIFTDLLSLYLIPAQNAESSRGVIL